MEQTAHRNGTFARTEVAGDDRTIILESIATFLAVNDLKVTPANLAAAHAAVKGSDPVLARRIAERQAQEQPITQEWLDHAQHDQGEQANDRMNRLVDQLETTMADFAETTETARLRTEQSRDEVAKHSSSYEGGGDVNQVAMLKMSRAMLSTLQTIQTNIEESQADTATLRDNLKVARREADTDPLTGLPNRRAFERSFERMETEAKEAGGTLFVAMCDVDHFKRVNDDFGHQTGDNLLRAIAANLREHVSPVGLVARYGGEEFVLLVNGIDRFEAIERIDAARNALATRKFIARRQNRPIGQISFSTGIADVMEATDRQGAIACADAMLYRAKDAGRNRVIAAWEVN